MTQIKNANGYGSIYKLSGNRRRPWAVRITSGWVEGKQKYKMVGYYKTRKEAQIALAEYNQDPYDIEARKITFAEVYEKWSAEHFPKVSKSRISTYRTVFKQSADLHKTPMAAIKIRHLQAQIDSKDLSRTTLRHHKNVYRQLFKYAIKHEIVDKNPADNIELPPFDTEQEDFHSIFTSEEIQALWDNVGKPNVDIVLILIYSGLRIMELLDMPISNVNLEERYMVGGSKTKAGKNRTIPINKKILPLIEQRYNPDNKYLIKAPRTDKYIYTNFRKNVWVEVMKSLGMKHTMHDTRHTFISLMDTAKINKTTIQRIAGHSSKDITGKYTHKQLPELIEAIDKI